MISVRDSTPDDAGPVDEVVASAIAMLRQTYRPSEKARSHKRAIAGRLHRLVAESDGAVVGTTQYVIDGSVIRIIGLGVHRDSRREGVARALVAEVADRARNRGLSAVVAHTVEETGNVRVFKALGFEVQSRCPDAYSESVKGGRLTDVRLTMQLEENSTADDSGRRRPPPGSTSSNQR